MKFITLLLMLLSFTAFSQEAKRETVVLTKGNFVSFASEFEDLGCSKASYQAFQADAKLLAGEQLYLVLSTPGGSISAGLDMIQFMQNLSRPVNTITLFAASMGFQTVQGLGKRYITPNGVLMSHKASGGAQGEFGDGDSQLDHRYQLWMKVVLELDKQTVKRTEGKQTLESYRKAYENELWLTGSEAVSQGYADAVVDVKCDSTLLGTHVEKFNFFGLIDVTLTMSDCPLITAPVEVKIDIIQKEASEQEKEKAKKKANEFIQKLDPKNHFKK